MDMFQFVLSQNPLLSCARIPNPSEAKLSLNSSRDGLSLLLQLKSFQSMKFSLHTNRELQFKGPIQNHVLGTKVSLSASRAVEHKLPRILLFSKHDPALETKRCRTSRRSTSNKIPLKQNTTTVTNEEKTDSRKEKEESTPRP